MSNGFNDRECPRNNAHLSHLWGDGSDRTYFCRGERPLLAVRPALTPEQVEQIRRSMEAAAQVIQQAAAAIGPILAVAAQVIQQAAAAIGPILAVAAAEFNAQMRKLQEAGVFDALQEKSKEDV